MGFFEWIAERIRETWATWEEQEKRRKKNNAIRCMREARSLKTLEMWYDALDDELKNDPEIKNLYEAQKKALPASPLEAMKEDTLGWLGEEIAKGIRVAGRVTSKALEPTIKKMLKSRGVSDSDIEDVVTIMNSGEFGIEAVVSFVLGITLYPAISKALEPAMEVVGQTAWSNLCVNILSDAELVRLKKLEKLEGINYREEMSKLGYDEAHQKAKENLYLYYPSATDFIRFAVRDVFRSETVEKYGYDKEFPTDIVPYAEKAGVDKETLQWYWRAHWEIPPPTMGYEMLHRGVITEEELKTLLKIQDIAPYWVDKLIQISYAPLTRVDARRMYETGAITRDRFVRAMKDLGYTDEDAEAITAWVDTVRLTNERDLTKSQILDAYKFDEISRETAKTYLQDLGYDAEEAELILLIDEDKRRMKEVNDQITILRRKYVNGTITESELEAELEKLNLTQRRIRYEMERARLDFEATMKMPTKADLEKWLKQKIITEDQFKERMLRLGYLLEDIDYYIKSAKRP